MQGRKGRKTADEERKLMLLLGKSYDFLNTNFTKFDQKTKVSIALTLIAKRVPQEIKQSSDVVVKVIHEDIEERLNWVQSLN